jgi:ankyrin repeat protein
MAALLVMAGADLSLVDSNDDTALHLAVGGGCDGIVRLLLEKGADPQALNSLGFSGLHILAERTSLDMTPAHLRIADALIQAGGDLTQHDNRGFTPLVAAAATGNIPIAAVFVARHADVSAEDGAALRQAVTFEDDDMTDLLIKAGAFVDQPSFPDQDQPLHTAAQEGFAHGVKVLLDKGADIEARNIDGETPLLVAVRCRKYEVVSLLLARGASVAAEDHYGVTAAGAAEQRRDQVMLRLLTPAEALKV